MFEWDGPDSPSDRVLGTLLPICRKQSVRVVPAIRCTRKPTDLANWTRTLVNGHGLDPAVARVGDKPVVFFTRATAKHFDAGSWKTFFRNNTDTAKSFNVVEGYDPKLLAHFDGLYWNPTSPIANASSRDYVAAYVHALFRKKAFVARGARGFTANMRPAWVVGNAAPEDPCACVTAKAPDGPEAVTFSVTGYADTHKTASPALRKHWSRRGYGRHAWRKKASAAKKRAKPTHRKRFSSKRLSRHSWRETERRDNDALLTRNVLATPAPRKHHSSKHRRYGAWRRRKEIKLKW